LRAIATAGSIQANLDIAFGRDPYFFGSNDEGTDVEIIAMFTIFILEKFEILNEGMS
jgi:hypothetical protein